MSLFETTALRLAGLRPDSPAAQAAEGRANIFGMSADAEAAVLTPKAPGAWPHALRAALAARIARLNDDTALADHYSATAGDMAALADPDAEITDPDLMPVLAFMDKVARRTGQVAADDITALQAAGVADADIVRLAELNAFVSYLVRVTAGLRLLKAGAP